MLHAAERAQRAARFGTRWPGYGPCHARRSVQLGSAGIRSLVRGCGGPGRSAAGSGGQAVPVWCRTEAL